MNDQREQGMAILVTGSTGFIGTALVEELARQAAPVVPTVRKALLPADTVLDLGAPLHPTLFDGVDRVVHLAGLSDRRAHTPSEFASVNYEATIRLARAAADAGVRHFIWASSVFVHGDSTNEPIDVHSPLLPIDSYARSKRDAEADLADLAKTSDGMQITILRLPLVIADSVARRNMAERLVRLLPVIPVPSPTNQRSFVRRDVLVTQIADLLQSEHGDSQIIIPAPNGVTGFEHVLRSSAESTNRSPRFLRIPRRAFSIADAMARRLGRPSITGLYADFEVVGSARPLENPSASQS